MKGARDTPLPRRQSNNRAEVDKRLGVLLDNCKKKKEKGDEPSETTPNKEENSLNDENQDG